MIISRKKFVSLRVDTTCYNPYDMNLQTSLSGRLRNTNLPKKSALFPLFEAIVNSIHAIDERIESFDNYDLENSKITISLLRSAQGTLDGSKPEIIGFQIEDNGIGFNSKNYESFLTLDSEYKIAKGCKGIGRLIWLKAFSSVKIKSVFTENNKWYLRQFTFNVDGLFNEKLTEIEPSIPFTKVILQDIKKEYLASISKTVDTIANKIIDHCFWYFLRDGGAPNIIISDDDDNVNLNAKFEYSNSAEILNTSIEIKGVPFEITHIHLKEGSPYSNKVLFGAANRLVISENLEPKIQGLYGDLENNGESFSYVCFVSSQFLTDNVAPERLGFNIPEKKEDIAFEDISLEEIKEAVVSSVSEHLYLYLRDNLQRTEDRINSFVNTQEPRYRSIVKYLTPEDKAFNPNIKDSVLEIRLHKRLMELERQLMTEGRSLVYDECISDDDFNKRLHDYLEKAADSKASDLASYVAKRKVIIDLLERALERQDDGKYTREETIHKLIMPMRQTSESLPTEEYANLWLIDERLAFHAYLASDKTIKSMPITSDASTKEPDLCALNIYDNPLLVNEGASRPLAAITVVELKRPMRDDAKEGIKDNPIEQALNYLEKIRQGEATDPKGRPIPAPNDIPGFCYIICDITSTIKQRCKAMGCLQESQDKMGYFGFHPNYKAYIEVISFDKLLQQAKERNRMFFQKLGIPSGL